MHAGPHVDVNETTYRQTATQKHAFKHANISKQYLSTQGSLSNNLAMATIICQINYANMP